MDIVLAQCITIAIFFVSMFISCLLPLKIVPTGPNYKLGIILANCLSAGVFLATFFVGLLPEVRKQFHFLMHQHQIITRFPVTDFIVCCGFFLALFAEQAVLAYKNHVKRKEDTKNALKELKSDENSQNDILGFSDAHNGNQNGSLEQHSHSHSHDFTSAITESGIRVGLLLSSLGVHSIFEGMTLGLQRQIHDLFNLFVGVLIHECLIAFAIGVNIASAKLKLLTSIKLAVLISSTIPIGQIIGFVIGNNESVYNGAVSVFLQAIAAGTFIQVTFMEIIPEGLQGNRNKFLKLLFFAVGFCIIAVVLALTDVNDYKKDKVEEDFNSLLKLKYNSIHL